MNALINSLDPRLRPYANWLYQSARSAGLEPRVTSGRRSRQQQAVLYDRYLRGMQPYPVARPGTSQHEYGLAFDMVVERPEIVGAWWQQVGGRWGGSNDPVHFGV